MPAEAASQPHSHGVPRYTGNPPPYHGGYGYRGYYGYYGVGYGGWYGYDGYGGYYPGWVGWYAYPDPLFPSDSYSVPMVAGLSGPAPAQAWYWCANPAGYYPYVAQCAGGWQAVTPPPAAGTTGDAVSTVNP